MNSRERFANAMAHRQPDRPPLDIGATTLTSMSAGCQTALRAFLGLSGEPVMTNSGVDERILEWAGTDFRAVGGIIDLPSSLAREISPSAMVDCWGIRRDYVDRYWAITHSPLRNASTDDLHAYPWPEARIDEKLLNKYQQQSQKLHAENRHVVVGEHPVYGILELGCWMCGYDEFLTRLVADRDFVRTFFDKVFEIQMAISEQYYSAIGPYLDVTTSGDDFGMQTGPLISPKMFEELIAPYFSARVARTKELAKCYFWHHSCGSIFALLGQIINCGVDILNPIQVSADHMEPQRLKSEFGNRLIFWGAVDVQEFLPNASPDRIRNCIRELTEVLGKDGGYVMAPAHNMQDDIPPQNIVTWVEAFHEIGRSPPNCE